MVNREIYRSDTGIQTLIRPEAPNILNISITRNGNELIKGDDVFVGDQLQITIKTEPTGTNGIFLVGTNPKPDCVLCNLDCAKNSQHFLQQNFTGNSSVLLEVTQEWVDKGPIITIAPSIPFTIGGDQFCLASFPTFELIANTAAPSPPENRDTINLPIIGEVSTIVAATGFISIAAAGLILATQE